MKIPTRLRRPFYNKSEIHPDGPNGEERITEAENGQNKEDAKPKPVGFWHPELRKVRNRAFAKWAITTTVLMAFIIGILSIYWGVFFNIQDRFKHLAIYVVDMDGVAPYDNTGNQPLVGPAITRLVEQQLSSNKPTLGWHIRPASEFNNDPIQVRQAVYNFDAWAAITINPNATALLYQAISTGNTSYDPLGACQLVYQDARDSTNWNEFIFPIISQFMTQAQSTVGKEWASKVMQNASDSSTLQNIQSVPQAINPAIGFSEFNLRPFYPYVGTPAVSIGLIYLIIISFFSFSFYLPIHMAYLTPKGHPPLHFPQLILWRYLATLTAYLFLSLAYSLISLAFQLNFSTTNPIASETQSTLLAAGNPISYGKATFVVYWMLNFWGMVALGLACENVAMIVGMPWMGLFLIFWVITNVSTGLYDVEVAPGFYRWGYAWPLHSVVEGSRQILFGLHSRIGLDFGVLIAWGAVNTALFPFCCWFMRWKSKKGVQHYWESE